jgi:Arc/MetJ-type ribon-helix-helix transcriptional regulator
MNITLTSEQAQFIQQELERGHYASVNDLFSAALSLLAQRHDHDQWTSSPLAEPVSPQRQLLDRLQQRRQQRLMLHGNIDSTAMLREDRDRFLM